MAKNFKAIICPQCNGTDAEKLSDGSFKCKYCGCMFIVDDDAKTQNINVNINIHHEESAPSYPNPKKISKIDLNIILNCEGNVCSDKTS